MPNSHFGFSVSPFENNLDQRFLFLSDDHQEVLAAILYFVETEKGLAMLCGDFGTGKTMLINSLVSRLPATVQLIILSNPNMNAHDLLYYLAKKLGINTTGKENFLELIDDVKIALMEARCQDKQFVLVIDEAHLLSDKTLEEIRLLSNIETNEQKLLQILLVGQYELSHKLDRPEMRHLRQRINVNRFLSPLTYAETISYIDHRLHQVGSSFGEVFEDSCKKLIFKLTQGVPRRINQLCESALMVATTEGQPRVDPKVLKIAEEALQTDRKFASEARKKGKAAALIAKSSKVWAPLGAVTTIVLLGIIAWKLVLWPGKSQPAPQFNKLLSFYGLEAQLSPPAPGIKATPEPLMSQNFPKTPKLPVKPAPPVPEQKHPAPLGPTVKEVLPQPKIPASRQKKGLGPVTAMLDQTEAPIQVKSQPSEPQVDAPVPVKPQPVEPAIKHVIPHAGDTLSHIATRYYPEDSRLGEVAIILQNPRITNENLVVSGAALTLPKINFKNHIIQLQDKLFYYLYGRYTSQESFKKIASWLTFKKVKFLVRNSRSGPGGLIHRIFLGGYATSADLEKTLANLNTKKR
jgi:type II secretory pathway predicted ATPase ExeA